MVLASLQECNCGCLKFNVYGDRLYVQILCYVRCVMYGVLVECQRRMEVKHVHNMCTCAESQRRSSTGLTQLWSLPIKVFHNWSTCMFFIMFKMMEVLCRVHCSVPGTVCVECQRRSSATLPHSTLVSSARCKLDRAVNFTDEDASEHLFL